MYSTDAGLSAKPGAVTLEPDDWAVISEGNVDLYNLQNFGAVSFYD
ncbi:hypothetical protein QWA68_006891 [Fusarium oxysporum]|nr:hypothetical protein QWA68_006891 [Fusarium oxysporum]